MPIMETLTVGANTYDIQDARIGDLSDLTTTAKSTVVDAINEAAQGGGGSTIQPYTSNPAAPGTASPGSSDKYARGDHVHPAQTVPAAQSSGTPAALGTAARGSATTYSRSDHVHAMPSAADVGAIAAPSSPSSGQFLVYNGSAWVAQTVPSANGVSF